MGFMRSLFYNYTKITPLENRSHTVWIYYKQQILIFAWNHWVNGFYEVAFPLLHTNHPPWKTGATQFEWITSKKFHNLHETTEAMGLWGRFSIITHKSPAQPPKFSPFLTQFNCIYGRLKKKNFVWCGYKWFKETDVKQSYRKK